MTPVRCLPLLLLLAASACGVPGLEPERDAHRSHDCRSGDVRVDGGTTEDTLAVCAAARSVSGFFRNIGLSRTAAITVLLVDRMPSENGDNVLGCFNAADAQVKVLSWRAASDRGRWLGQSIDRTLYHSLVAHEIAHALAWCNAPGNTLSVRASEYVAYVVMFATMESGRREAILADAPGVSFDREGEISDTFYYLAPSRFGVAAYRHYLRPENGARFLRAVLSGAALPAVD